MTISISCLAAGSSGDSGPFSRGLDLVGISGLQEWSVSQLEFEAKKEVGPPHCTSGSFFLSRFGSFQSAEQSTCYQGSPPPFTGVHVAQGRPGDSRYRKG